ncbi:MAG: LacI family DNA-binding transcriptional regulator [Butyricicoccus sp.]
MTIEKIAELAGVSRGAVDKVIHGRPGVRPDVRERVLQIIRQTGYVPPRVALDPVCKTVAVIMPRTTNTYFSTLKETLDGVCRSCSDLVLRYHFCETTDIDSQLAALDQPADAWLIRGVCSERLRERLNALGRPVFFLDAEVPGVPAVCKIGEDCYKSGRIAASLLAKCIDYHGKVVVIAGSPEIPSHRQRLEGFLDIMRDRFPGIEVADRLYSQDQSVVAYAQACRTLDRFPDLDGICNLAGYAGEIGQAILQRQRAIKMVCYDITSDVAALVEKGIVEFSIGLELTQQAHIIINILRSYLLFGIQPPSAFVETPIAVAFDENIASMLPVKTHGKTHENRK